MICRLVCWFTGHRWYEMRVFERSWDAYDSEFTCRRCGQTDRARITY